MRPVWILVLAIVVVGLLALALSAVGLLRRRRPLLAAAAAFRSRQGEFTALARRVRALDADLAVVRERATETADGWVARGLPTGRGGAPGHGDGSTANRP
ncbi:hypothetical protein [Actinocatenispora rupis]|uniref:Uncharacterized protein n=1 Tax=Actinocatenispora rupis TaxID=519421 RepID=A0A8J3NBW8_9ACTN|nr:hypothetical protein [Actinocatenispora rupis]GID11122.1 hypothetical protein Aru02nite_20110 [Actinocatenispora rupis]